MAKLDKSVRSLLDSLEQKKKDIAVIKELSDVDWKTSGTIKINGFDKSVKSLFKKELVKVSDFIFSQNKNIDKIEQLFELSENEKESYSLIQGYSKEDWLHDLKKRWHFVDYNEKLKEIDEKIKKTKDLLSEDEIKKMKLEKIIKDS